MAEAKDPEVVLVYQGDASGARYIPGVPARDLTDFDIARLVHADDRFADEVEGDTGMTRRRMEPDDKGFAKAAEKYTAELIRNGLYAPASKEGSAKKVSSEKGIKAAASSVADKASDVPPAPEANPTPVVGEGV